MERIEARILHEVATSSKTFWELLKEVDAPLSDILAAIEKLENKGFIAAEKGKFCITENGKARINSEALSLKVKVCLSCSGKRIIPGGRFKKVLKVFKEIVRKRPEPSLDFFQGYMLETDVVARAAFMHYYGDLEEKSIVLIGDDDLLSIALALTGLPKKIVVLDIDRRLGDFLKRVNEDYCLDIKFFEYDVSGPLPKELKEKFDVVSSEPLETVSGLKAFILRGVACLKSGGSGYFGLTNYEASLKKWLKVQELLVKTKCVITDIIQGFSVYPTKYGKIDYDEFATRFRPDIGKNPGINWYKSALIRFELLGKARSHAGDKRIKIDYIDSEELSHPEYFKIFHGN